MFRNPTTDAIVVLLIVLLIFGPKRLPALGRDLGQGLREFKNSITGGDKEAEEGERPALEAPAAHEPVVGEPASAGHPDHQSAPVGPEPRP